MIHLKGFAVRVKFRVRVGKTELPKSMQWAIPAMTTPKTHFN